MNALEIGLIAALVLLAVITGIDALPTILFVLNPDSMRIAFDDPAAEQERLSRSAELRDWIHRLKEIGFSSLGVKAERLPLRGKTFREAALVSRTADTYASIVLRPDGSPVSMYLFTPFENGGMVFTRDNAFGREMENEQISVKNIPSRNFRDVMDSHEERLRVFLEKGWRPRIGSGQQARIEATGVFYKSAYARQPGIYLATPALLFFFLLIVLLLAAGIWKFFILPGAM